MLVAVLAGVLYFFVLKPGGGASGGRKDKDSKAPSATEEAYQNIQSAFVEDDVDVDSLLAKIEDVRFDYGTAHETRNPMKPLVGTNPELDAEEDIAGMGREGVFDDSELLYFANNLSFTGIVYDPKVPLAIIDNEMTYVGYSFPEVKGLVSVKQINEDNVVLEVQLEEGPIEHVQRLKEPEAL